MDFQPYSASLRDIFLHIKESQSKSLCRDITTFGIILWMLIALPDATAQTPAPLASNLQLYTNGFVWASVRQANGGVIFGGHFSQVNGVPRQNIARLNPDGTLDTTWWAEGVHPVVRSLAVDIQDNVYVGAAGIWKISTNGKRDPNWPLSFVSANSVNALAVDSKGNIFAGGSFSAHDATGINDVNKLAKFLPSGTLDATWTPNPSIVYALVLDGDDNLYVGGIFTSIGGQLRNKIAKISTSGGGAADPTWNPAPSLTGSTAQIRTLAVDGTGNLFVGGTFDAIGGQARRNIAKLSTSGSGSADPDWATSADGAVLALACDHNGSVYAGGSFTTIGTQPRVNLAKLATGGTGNVDGNWNASTDAIASNNVSTITVAGGQILAGGFFSTIAGEPRHSFAAVGSSGKPSSVSDATQSAIVKTIATQADGGMIVGGLFSGAGSFLRNNVLRLRADSTIDPNWNTSTDTPGDVSALGVEAIAIDNKSGAVYLGGSFTQVGGKQRKGIAKLSSSGMVDPAWGPGTDVTGGYFGVQSLALAPDGSVYLGGDFLTVGGHDRAALARISSMGEFDAQWNSDSNFTASYLEKNSGPMSLAVDTDGSLYADHLDSPTSFQPCLRKYSPSGTGAVDSTWRPSADGNPPLQFSDICGGVTALKLDGKGNLFASSGLLTKLLTQNGKADTNWKPAIFGAASLDDYRYNYLRRINVNLTQSTVYTLALDSQDNLYVGGTFSHVGQSSRPYLAKIPTSGNGTADSGWNPGPDDSVYALAFDANGVLKVGGLFSTFGHQPRVGFASVPASNSPKPTVLDHLNQFGWTGAWYNPATSGQGLLLHAIPGQAGQPGTLFGGWFTYDPSYGQGQLWYSVQGQVDNTSKIAALSVYAPISSSYNPGSLSVGYQGEVLLDFSDCMHATMTYMLNHPSSTPIQNPQIWAYGSIPLTRLGSNYLCSANGDMPDQSAPDFLLSGAWYDPSVKYNGFVFDLDPALNTFFAAWYQTSPANSSAPVLFSRRWYTLQGNFTPGSRSLNSVPIYQGAGGMLDYPTPVTVTEVGTAKLVFFDCSTATLNYSFTQGVDAGKNGTLNLTHIGGTTPGCSR